MKTKPATLDREALRKAINELDGPLSYIEEIAQAGFAILEAYGTDDIPHNVMSVLVGYLAGCNKEAAEAFEKVCKLSLPQ